jgi:protein-tyrosine phosphatase
LLFREVELPDGVTGGLFLHSMPGLSEPLADIYAAFADQRITRVICLARRDEIEWASPGYIEDLKRGSTPLPVQECPVRDRHAPCNPKAFVQAAQSTARDLVAGARVLVHCFAGHGRTGMFATCVVMALGPSRGDAEARVEAAGSKWESAEQEEFLGWAAHVLQAERT